MQQALTCLSRLGGNFITHYVHTAKSHQNEYDDACTTNVNKCLWAKIIILVILALHSTDRDSPER